jgi:hypothetical protein
MSRASPFDGVQRLALHAIFTSILSALHTTDVGSRKHPKGLTQMDTGHRPARPRAGGRTRKARLSLPDVTALLASVQLPGLPADAADRIRKALAAESADRAAAARETHAPVHLPPPRTGKELPPLTRVVPLPREATAAV